MKTRVIVVTGLLLIALASPFGPSAAPLHPLTVGWEQYFTVDWRTDTHQGRPVVYGRVHNNWGFAATNVRLLVDGVNEKGEIVNQTIEWLGAQLTPGTTAPFEVAVAGHAPAYRVSVFAFDWVQRGRGLN